MEKLRSEKDNLEVINFTNIDDEDFTGHFGGEKKVTGTDDNGKAIIELIPTPYLIKKGETKAFPRFLAEHFAKHLADKILRKKGVKGWGEGTERTEVLAKILGNVAVSSMPAEPEETEPEEEGFKELDEIEKEEGIKGETEPEKETPKKKKKVSKR